MRKLILTITRKDCRLETFPAGGPGGQNQNKRDTAARWTHVPSGAVGESREHRHQWQNKKAAWRRMAEHPKMQVWIQRKTQPEEIAKAEVTRRYTYKGNISLEGRKMDRD